MRPWGLAVVAALALATTASLCGPSVSLAETAHYWNSCQKTGGGYTDSTCSTLGAGGFEWTKILEGTPTTFTAGSTSSFTFKMEIFSVMATIVCKSQSSKGTIENPGGAKAATVPSMSFKMSSCTFSKPAGCEVPEGSLGFVPLQGTTGESGEKRMVNLESAKVESNPKTITTLIIEGPSCPLGELMVVVVGTIGAVDNPSTSSLEFTSTSSHLKPFYTEPTAPTLEGTTKLQTAGGEALKLTP